MNKSLILCSILLAISATIIVADEQMPMYAKPGQCFTKTFYPPKVTKVTRIKSTKKIITKDSSIRYDVIPAKYSWVSKRVKVSDGTEEIIATPAIYKTVYERIMVEPPSKIWRRGTLQTSPKAFSSCVESAKLSGMDVENATVGTCFYEHIVPAKYKNVTSKILLAEASERYIVTPATYRTVVKKIVVDNTTEKLIPSVAKYKKLKAKVEIEPARTEWRKTVCKNRGCDESEVICLVEVPVTYKTITKRIVLEPAVKKVVSVKPTVKTFYVKEMVTPPTQKKIKVPAKYQTVVQKREISKEKHFWTDYSGKNATTRYRLECDKICLVETPAKYKTVAKQVVVKPATIKKIKTPPEYKIVKVKKIEKKASFKKVVVPAEYITIRTERERTKGFAKWVPMVCESMMTPKLIRKIQRALKFQGFYNGIVDGRKSLELKKAIRAYQRAKGLTVTNKISIETMKALKIY